MFELNYYFKAQEGFRRCKKSLASVSIVRYEDALWARHARRAIDLLKIA